MKKADGIISAAFLLFSVFTFIKAGELPAPACTFPKVFSIALGIFSFALLMKSIFTRYRDIILEESNNTNIVMLCVLSIIYMISITYLGYYLATFIFLIITIFLMGYRKKVTTLIVSLAITAVLYGSFKLFLQVPTPKGIL